MSYSTPNVDTSKMSDEEFKSYGSQLFNPSSSTPKNSQQVSSGPINPNTYTPSAQDIADAQHMTGTDQGQFLAGVGKSFVDTGRAVKQGWDYLFGNSQGIKDTAQQQADENALFSKTAGLTGSAGELTGSVLQGIAGGGLGSLGAKAGLGALARIGIGESAETLTPGMQAIQNAKEALNANKFTTAVKTGALGGAGFAAVTPTTDTSSGDNFLSDKLQQVATGGVLGGILGGAGNLVMKGAKGLLTSSSTKAQNAVTDMINKQVANMDPEEADRFVGSLNSFQNDPSKFDFTPTPGQVIGKPSALSAQASMVNTPSGYQHLLDLNANQAQNELQIIRGMGDALPNKEALQVLSPKDLTSFYVDSQKMVAQRNSAPYYNKLINTKVSDDQLDSIMKDPVLLDAMQKAQSSPAIAADIRSNISTAMNNTTSQEAGTALAPTLTMNDLHNIYRNAGDVVKSDDPMIVKDIKGRLTNILGTDPNFTAANAEYAKAMDPLNQLGIDNITKDPNNIYGMFTDKPTSIFDVKDPAQADGLANWMQRNAPRTLAELSHQKLMNTINSIGTGVEPKTVVEQLQRIQQLNPKDTLIGDITNKLINGMSAPDAIINKVGEGSGHVGAGIHVGFGGVHIVPHFGFMSKLRSESYQRAVGDMLYNPSKWAPLAQSTLDGTNSLSDVLDAVKTNVVGAVAGGR